MNGGFIMLDINKMRENQASVKEGLEYDNVHDFDDLQMDEIRRGLIYGLNVSVYAKPELSWKQREEIRRGLPR